MSHSFVTPRAVARQAPLSMGFSRQEYWSGLRFPSPGDLPNPGTEPTSSATLALAGRFFTTEPPFSSLQFSSVAQSCLTLCNPISSLRGQLNCQVFRDLPLDPKYQRCPPPRPTSPQAIPNHQPVVECRHGLKVRPSRFRSWHCHSGNGFNFKGCIYALVL